MPRCSTCLQESVCTACTTTGGPFYLSYPPSNCFFISKTHVSHVNKHDLIVWHVHQLQESAQPVQLVRTSFTWKTTVVFPVLPVVLFVQVWPHVPLVSTRLLVFIIKCVLLAVNLFPTVSNAAVQPHAQCVQTIQLWTQVEVRFFIIKLRLFFVLFDSVSWWNQPTLSTMCQSLLLMSQQWWLFGLWHVL